MDDPASHSRPLSRYGQQQTHSFLCRCCGYQSHMNWREGSCRLAWKAQCATRSAAWTN